MLFTTSTDRVPLEYYIGIFPQRQATKKQPRLQLPPETTRRMIKVTTTRKVATTKATTTTEATTTHA
jgi:hypothetical protein